MRSFYELKEEMDKLETKINKAAKTGVSSEEFLAMDAQDINAYGKLLSEISAEITDQKDVMLVLQEIKDTSLVDFNRTSLLGLYKMVAIVSGVLNNVDEVESFALDDDSGFAMNRLQMVQNVVARKLSKNQEVQQDAGLSL